MRDVLALTRHGVIPGVHRENDGPTWLRVLTWSLASAVVVAASAGVAVFARAVASASGSSDRGGTLLVECPRIVIHKAERKLLLYDGERLVRTYPVGLGQNPTADKKLEGDMCTPIGSFYVDARNPESRFTLSLGISYPNAEDAERGIRDGLITVEEHDAIVESISTGGVPPQHTALGGDIYIHGAGSGSDWTWGCIALDDDAIREVYAASNVGTAVTITP